MAMKRCSYVVLIACLGCTDSTGGDGDSQTDSATEDDGETSESDDATETSDGESDSGSDSDSDSESDSSESDSSGETAESNDATESETGELEGDDYDQPGPYTVDIGEGSLQATPDCQLSYATFTPSDPQTDVPVILAHGFMRSIDDMAETAEHVASWGVPVITAPLCTNDFQIDHAQNGQALAALGQALAPDGAVYAGFSAGGLATFVAAANDPNAVAYVGLDPVDSGGLAEDVAGAVAVPVRAAIAEPGQCNTNNNFLPVLATFPGSPVIRVVAAQHFDFETDACAPGDLACTFCAPAGASTRALALGLVTAGILVETGADPGGDTWWGPGGAYFDELAQAGQIQLIQ